MTNSVMIKGLETTFASTNTSIETIKDDVVFIQEARKNRTILACGTLVFW
jgi:hypothetical protein